MATPRTGHIHWAFTQHHLHSKPFHWLHFTLLPQSLFAHFFLVCLTMGSKTSLTQSDSAPANNLASSTFLQHEL